MANTTPAVAVSDGWVAMNNWLAPAGLTTMLVEMAEVKTGTLVNWSVMVSALLSARSVKVAMPPETVSVMVPWSGPSRLAARRP